MAVALKPWQEHLAATTVAERCSMYVGKAESGEVCNRKPSCAETSSSVKGGLGVDVRLSLLPEVMLVSSAQAFESDHWVVPAFCSAW
jgi:hypothetical protein